MATFQLDGLLDDGKKQSSSSGAGINRDIVDMSRVVVNSDHELQRLLEKVPDFKIRADKNAQQFDQNAIDGEQMMDIESGGASSPTYPFADPVPTSMKDVDIRELGRVDINWRMLTTARPKNRTEEDIFTRFVQLEKLQYQTVKWEADDEMFRERRAGSLMSGRRRGTIPRGRSRGGALTTSTGHGGTSRGGGGGGSSRSAITEIRLQTCRECGEEFCAGSNCKKYLYEEHARTLNPPSMDDVFRVGPLINPNRSTTSKIKSQSKMVASTTTNQTLPNQTLLKSTPTAASIAVKPLMDLMVSGETKRTSVKEITTTSRSSKSNSSKASTSKTGHKSKHNSTKIR